MKLIYPILLVIFIFPACKKEKTLFVLLDSKQTGITFNNQITEADTLNILNSEFIYNGGGVGIGDFNGDGLQDVFFTGNQVDNKLYLNRGKLQFEDITAKAGLQKQSGQWSSGINILDINNDGKQDLYVCNTFGKAPKKEKTCSISTKVMMRQVRLFLKKWPLHTVLQTPPIPPMPSFWIMTMMATPTCLSPPTT